MDKFNKGDLVTIVRHEQYARCFLYSDLIDRWLEIRLDALYDKAGVIKGVDKRSDINMNVSYIVKLDTLDVYISIYEDNLKRVQDSQKDDFACVSEKFKNIWMKNINEGIVEIWRNESSFNLRTKGIEIEEELIKCDKFNSYIEAYMNNIFSNDIFDNKKDIFVITKNLDDRSRNDGIFIPVIRETGEPRKFGLMVDEIRTYECVHRNTKDKIEQIQMIRLDELANIDITASKIQRMIKDCNTYIQSIEILEEYGIVKQNKLNAKTYDNSFFHINE